MSGFWHWALERYTARAYRRWERALADPEAAQIRVLSQILREQCQLPQGAETSEQTALTQIRQLPLRTYEALPDVSTLTHRSPLFYELTSGSSGHKKRIPYTRPLLQSFTDMFLCWAHDLLRALRLQGRPFAGGQVYFSVSPQFMTAASGEATEATEAGLQDDADYLTGLSARLMRRFQAVPSQVKHLQAPEHFWDVVALGLLRAPQLEVISVWSPSFLRVLQRHVQTHARRLSACLEAPCVRYEGLDFVLPVPPPARRRRLQAALKALAKEANTPRWVWAACFPHLKLISCWGAAQAATDFAALRRDFAFAHVQEKGLLATEAPLTIPSEHYGGFLPLPHLVFYEFLPLTETFETFETSDTSISSAHASPHPLLLHELSVGQRYEVVISQLSGLLRYRLKDTVYVSKKQGATPFLHFTGRRGALSDLVGEKLQADVVAQGLQQCYGAIKTCLIPQATPAGYVLCSEAPVNAEAMERYLCQNPHYANARRLGQLQALEQLHLPDLGQHLRDFFVIQRQMKWGDIKDQALYYRESDGELLAFLRNHEYFMA